MSSSPSTEPVKIPIDVPDPPYLEPNQPPLVDKRRVRAPENQSNPNYVAYITPHVE